MLIFAVQKNERFQRIFAEGVAKYQWVMNHFVFIKIQHFMGNHQVVQSLSSLQYFVQPIHRFFDDLGAQQFLLKQYQ